MEEIYDINFIMPVTDLAPYGERLKDMKKYGILNPGRHRVKITLLLGPKDIFEDQNLLTGWAGDYLVETVRTPYIMGCQKIAYYYSQVEEEEIESAKWHIKIDDDTANDICGLIEDLSDYDPSDRLYLVTEVRYEIDDAEKEVLRVFGKYEWLHSNKISHEYEACILSSKAMLAIKNNQEAKEYLQCRANIGSGYTDQMVGVALKFCKLPPIAPGFMSVRPRINEFSLFGGKFSHIHFFRGRGEGMEKVFQYYRRLFDNKKEAKEKENSVFHYEGTLIKLFSNNKMLFGDTPGLWTAAADGVEFSFDESEGTRILSHKKKINRIMI